MNKKRKKMNKIIYIYIILILILCACGKQKEKSIDEKLRGSSYKYWLAYKYYPSTEIDTIFSTEEYIYMNYFDKNGKYLLFYKQNLLSSVKKDSENSIPDIVNSNTWRLENDSVLIINDVGFQIKILEEDMMVLYSPYSKRYALYITAPDSLIPPKYHCIQGSASE